MASHNCNSCGIIFNEDSHVYKGKCQTCQRKYAREYAAKNKERFASKIKERKAYLKELAENSTETKICSKCKENKLLKAYEPQHAQCKDCRKAYGRNYNKVNKHIRDKWINSNKERHKELQAMWYQRNKEKRNAKEKERKNIEPAFRLKITCKTRLRQSIKKNYATVKYIGTSVENLKEWIQFCFSEKMSFNNHGSYWHVDHVIPISLFDLTNQDDIDLCFNWRNLSPLSAKENLSKNKKLNYEQIREHFRSLIRYAKTKDIEERIETKKYMKKWLNHIKSI